MVQLPPFASVIKSREVEDPVNVWLHRPLAYGFVALTLRTPLTPNQITFIALVVGLAAGVCWLIGTPALMLIGGILLWSSAILDGADGIMARAKKMQSELGRAFDGFSDMIVAQATVLPAFLHIWLEHREPYHLIMMPIALGTAIAQVYMYDFYKESFLNSSNPGWDGRTQQLVSVKAHLARAEAEGAPFVVRFSWSGYVTMLTGQAGLIRLTNPLAIRDGQQWVVSDEATRIYRKHNYWPMRLWTYNSLCPHTYIMAIFAMLNRLDLYLWYRVVIGNALFIVVLIWQRIATYRTLRDLNRIGAQPVDETDALQTVPAL